MFCEWLRKQVNRDDGVGRLACLARVYLSVDFSLAELCVVVVRSAESFSRAANPWHWLEDAVSEFSGKEFGYDDIEG